jgi:hypothetical protein
MTEKSPESTSEISRGNTTHLETVRDDSGSSFHCSLTNLTKSKPRQNTYIDSAQPRSNSSEHLGKKEKSTLKLNEKKESDSDKRDWELTLADLPNKKESHTREVSGRTTFAIKADFPSGSTGFFGFVQNKLVAKPTFDFLKGSDSSFVDPNDVNRNKSLKKGGSNPSLTKKKSYVKRYSKFIHQISKGRFIRLTTETREYLLLKGLVSKPEEISLVSPTIEADIQIKPTIEKDLHLNIAEVERPRLKIQTLTKSPTDDNHPLFSPLLSMTDFEGLEDKFNELKLCRPN